MVAIKTLAVILSAASAVMALPEWSRDGDDRDSRDSRVTAVKNIQEHCSRSNQVVACCNGRDSCNSVINVDLLGGLLGTSPPLFFMATWSI
jgi:hypothetical protein